MAALNSYPGIEASAVTLRGNGEKRLTAYVVLKPGAHVTVASLRDALGRRLPEYMIPTVFAKGTAALDNERKDRLRRSAGSERIESLPENEFVAPQTVVEQRLAGILVPLLHVERVSAKDNFFLLGGHSLLGTQLITEIKESFDVELSLLSLFDHPTLEAMSVEVENLILEKMGAKWKRGGAPRRSRR